MALRSESEIIEAIMVRESYLIKNKENMTDNRYNEIVSIIAALKWTILKWKRQ